MVELGEGVDGLGEQIGKLFFGEFFEEFIGSNLRKFNFWVAKKVIGHTAKVGKGFEAVVDDGKHLFLVIFGVILARFGPKF